MASRRCKPIRWGFLQVELQVEILKDLDCNLLVHLSQSVRAWFNFRPIPFLSFFMIHKVPA